MAKSKIRLPQLRGDSLSEDLEFKPVGGNRYLKMDLTGTQVILGHADVNLVLDGIITGANVESTLAGSTDKIATASAIKSYADAMDLDITVDGGSGIDALVNSETLNFVSGEGINLAASGLDVTISAELATAAANAGASNIGSAGFADGDFDVTSGFVTIKAQGVDFDQIHGDAIQISSEAFADNDTSLMTSAAILDKIQSEVTAQDLAFIADSGGALAIDLDSEVLSILGTAGEIETAGSVNNVVIGLPNDVTISNDLTVSGNLIVNGEQSIVNTAVMAVEDKTMALGVPSGMKIATFARATNTVSFTLAGHGLISTNKVLINSSEQTGDGFIAEGIYTVTVSGNDVSFTHTGNDVTGKELSFSGNILDANQDGSGIIVPVQGGLAKIAWDNNNGGQWKAEGADWFVDQDLSVFGSSTFNDTSSFIGAITMNRFAGGTPFSFDGATSGGFKLSIAVTDPQANNTITFPDAAGTVAVAATAVSGVALSAAGLLSIEIDGANDGSSVAIDPANDELLMNDSDTGNSVRITIDKLAQQLNSTSADKISGTITNIVAAGTKVSNVNGFPNLAAGLLGNVNSAGQNGSKHEVYLNGMLLSRQADADFSGAATLTSDFGYDTDAAAGSPAPGLIFSFDLAVDDIVVVISRA